MRAVLARVWAEARHVRGARTLWRFLRWLARIGPWWLREGRSRWKPAPAGPGARPDPPLGASIAALGPRACAVFAASSRVARGPGVGTFDATLADTPAHAAGMAAPVVLLDEHPALSVPAFDPAVHNPIGWVREVEPRVAALGLPDDLPPGATAHRTVRVADRDALLHCHHLEDIAAFHVSAPERAGTLARLAACGVPVRLADRDPALETLLGAELHGLMCVEVRDADASAREALSIAMRRAALRTHSLTARAREVCAAARVEPPGPPLVTVLLATRRPWLLAHAVAQVAAQRYPRVELVLALHGPGFGAGAVEAALAGFAHPAKVLRCGEDRVFGSVLNEAAGCASGALLAKMDDDDLYGPEHLWDLVLAHEYSGGTLVGKFPATVYLARLDRTMRARRDASENWTLSITGGTMLLARADLERVGGWREVPRHVDAALVEDVVRTGGGVYHTHDAGYLLVRHGDDHTWKYEDAEFLADAESVHAGFKPALAGIDDARSPPSAPDRRAAR